MSTTGEARPVEFDEAVAAAKARWPKVAWSASALFGALIEREVDLDKMVPRSNFVDLLLATACLAGDTVALNCFDELLGPAVDSVARRMSLDADRCSEVKQRLRDKLLTGRGTTIPKLATFEAAGPLSSWLRVCAAREALMIARSDGKAERLEDNIERSLEPLFDPELHLLKADGRSALKQAFQRAFAELSARQKTLLAQNLIDGLTLRQIGRMHGVDASTISRWLQRAREQLLTRTRRIMTKRFDVDGAEFEEIVDLVRSQLDLSISRMLRE